MENKLEHSNLISPEVEGMQEERMEKSLRPQTLDEYIGQTKVKENMRIYIEPCNFAQKKSDLKCAGGNFENYKDSFF